MHPVVAEAMVGQRIDEIKRSRGRSGGGRRGRPAVVRRFGWVLVSAGLRMAVGPASPHRAGPRLSPAAR